MIIFKMQMNQMANSVDTRSIKMPSALGLSLLFRNTGPTGRALLGDDF